MNTDVKQDVTKEEYVSIQLPYTLIAQIKAKMMQKCAESARENADLETIHVEADALLLELLNATGVTEIQHIVKVFRAVDKWYA